MTPFFEEVASELAENLLPCPQCSGCPTIYRQTDAWRYKVLTVIACESCNKEWCGGQDQQHKRCLYPADANWQHSLYEAVAVWQTTAKILGSREKREESMSEHVARNFGKFQDAVIDDVIEGFYPP
jgi:hypothetical protein